MSGWTVVYIREHKLLCNIVNWFAIMLLVLLSVFSVFHLYSAQVPTPPAKNGMFIGSQTFSDIIYWYLIYSMSRCITIFGWNWQNT